MRTLMTTAGVPEAKRFAHWREAVCDHFTQVECYQMSDRVFDGEILTSHIKDVTFSLVRGREQKSVRTPSLIRRANEELVFIHHQLNGTWYYSQDSRKAKLEPGDFVCFDSTRPFSAFQSSDFEQLLLHVPRDLWVRRFGQTDQVTARVVSSGTQMGNLVANVLREIVSVVDTVEQVTAHRLLDVALSLITAAFGELVSHPDKRQNDSRVALLYRAKMFIEENLHDPELNPKKVAASLRICERYLQDLFHDESMSVGKWIWEMRLEKCRRDLSDPMLSGKSVSEIAFNYGFSNFSHFSRRFKEAFSMTASECRREQKANHLASEDLNRIG